VVSAVTNEEFEAFANELAERFRGSGKTWFVAVLKPGEGPHSASNSEVQAQILFLRALADSLESNAAEEIIRREL
jgi:hypothetical protein